MKKYILLILILFLSCEKEPIEPVDEFAECRESIELNLSKIDPETGLIEFDIIPDIVHPGKGNVISPKGKLWDKGIVNYAIQGHRQIEAGTILGFELEEDILLIQDALKEFSLLTDIIFIEYTEDELRSSGLNGLLIQRGFANASSHLGKQGGVQTLKLTSGLKASTTYHEVSHALGVRHEFTRKDRGEYVVVHYENIPERMYMQFDIDESSIDCGNFDIESVMMYGSFNVQRDSTKIEMSLRNGDTFDRSTTLSQGDITTIKTLYNNEFKKR